MTDLRNLPAVDHILGWADIAAFIQPYGRPLVVDAVRREFYVIPYAGYRIWGATAGILVGLAHILGSSEEVEPHAQGRC